MGTSGAPSSLSGNQKPGQFSCMQDTHLTLVGTSKDRNRAMNMHRGRTRNEPSGLNAMCSILDLGLCPQHTTLITLRPF